MPTGHYRFRRSLGNVNGRMFRGARPILDFSPEAQDYFSRLDAAGDTTYTAYKQPLANYIDGLIAASMWDGLASAASFIGVGIEGIVVPLRSDMPAITNNNFVNADLSQTDGLKGDGSTKYLLTGVSSYTDVLQDDTSVSAYVTADRESSVGRYVQAGAGSGRLSIIGNSTGGRARTNNSTLSTLGTGTSVPALVGWSRDSASDFDYLAFGQSGTIAVASTADTPASIAIFADSTGASATAARIATYHIGESLNLASLEALQDTLISEIAAI